MRVMSKRRVKGAASGGWNLQRTLDGEHIAALLIVFGGLAYLLGRLALKAEQGLVPLPVEMSSSSSVEQVAATFAFVLYEAALGLLLVLAPIHTLQRLKRFRNWRGRWWRLMNDSPYLHSVLVFGSAIAFLLYTSVELPLDKQSSLPLLHACVTAEDRFLIPKLAILGAMTAVLVAVVRKLWRLRTQWGKSGAAQTTIAAGLLILLLFAIPSNYGAMIKNHNWRRVAVKHEAFPEEIVGNSLAQDSNSLAVLVQTTGTKANVILLPWSLMRSIRQTSANPEVLDFPWNEDCHIYPFWIAGIPLCLFSIMLTAFLSPLLLPPADSVTSPPAAEGASAGAREAEKEGAEDVT